MNKSKNDSLNIIIPLAAVLIALIAGGIIIAITGCNPFKAYYAILQGNGIMPKKSYGASYGMFTDFMNFINYCTPMFFAALAIAVALKAGLFNIGVSGQMLFAGYLATVLVGYSELGAVLAKPLVILIGALAGGLCGALVGFLKYKFNINEVVSTIMFNYIFQYIGSFLINTYYVDTVTRQSVSINQSARLTLMDVPIGRYKVNIPLGIILAILAAVYIWYLFSKTVLGYEIRAVGLSKTAAKYAGINVGRTMVLSMTISGVLAGLSGVTYYLGYLSSIQPKVLVDTGYDAIAVSLLGNNNPLGIIFSTLLVSLIDNGSAYMKSQAGVEAEIASVILGIILIFSASNHYIRSRLALKNSTEKLILANKASGEER